MQTLGRRLLAAACVAGALQGRAQLRYEAEAVSGPAEAWLKDKQAPNRWTLWSTDQDADKKWSGGIVLQTPPVKADRATPEEGVPPLHTVIRDVPPGIYAVDVRVTRVLGVSLDGKEWRRFSGGVLMPSRRVAAGDAIEFWVDDRYAMEKEADRGSGYYDYVELTRVRSWEDGIANAAFEETDANGLPADWAWWSRDGKGTVSAPSGGAHSGARSAHLLYDGEQDWAFTNAARLAVSAGADLCVSGWVRGVPGAREVSIDVAGWSQGRLVSWKLGAARVALKDAWTEVHGYLPVSADVDTLQVRVTGRGPADLYLDDVALRAGKQLIPAKPPVVGWAKERRAEPMGRGAVALPLSDGTVRVSWRLLATDPADVGFDVWRRVGKAKPVRLNAQPLTETTDFLDAQAPAGERPTYSVAPTRGGGPAGDAVWAENEGGDTPFVRLRLADAKTLFQKVAVVDLNGDGAYDYVIKQPHENIDPWEKYWYKSPETYKLEAYLADGTFLWRNDLGWAIERGIWYSPYIAWDLTGDGKAEVAAKVGEGDPRDPDGRVTSGPEFVVVWDGLTGREIARAPWPDRGGFENYNLASRNQIAVAYLDGKTPCLLTLRGTYSHMVVHAYQLRKGTLQKLWEYDNADLGAAFWGQGAHFTQAADIDADGRDEVLLGSAVLDDTGVPLWTTGRGHPDAFYLTDVLPANPGLEIAYVMERGQASGGLNVVDARTGKTLWKLDAATKHVHGKGMCADIDPTLPGQEVYGADAEGHVLTASRWLFAADGTLLRQGKDCPWGFDISTLYWDADLQQELLAGKVVDYQGGPVGGTIRGSRVLLADVIGDWREEVIVSVAGELRIICTPIAAMDRRVCLMQDPVYRMVTAMDPMGYTQPPTLSYNPELLSPNLNLTVLEAAAVPTVRVVVSAPSATALAGRLVLDAGTGLQADPATFDVRLNPGGRQTYEARLSSARPERLQGLLQARLELAGGKVLRGQVPVALAGAFLRDGLLVQAEAFAAQEGGTVQVRDDKPGVMGKCISHWDAAGHALAWKVVVPTAGTYRLMLRYCTPDGAVRALRVDGRDGGSVTMPATGGFGTMASEWDHVAAATAKGPVRLELTAGEHTIRLENTDGKGCNLDYLALVAAP